MKKVSTVAAKPSKKISRQKLTVGLDLGDRNSWYCVLDESGQIQLEQRVRTNAKALREVFGAMPHSRIGLECDTHSTLPYRSRRNAACPSPRARGRGTQDQPQFGDFAGRGCTFRGPCLLTRQTGEGREQHGREYDPCVVGVSVTSGELALG
jgi:hypothetical protein